MAGAVRIPGSNDSSGIVLRVARPSRPSSPSDRRRCGGRAETESPCFAASAVQIRRTGRAGRAQHARDVVQMVDLIHPGLDAGFRRERLRHVAGHRHAERVRLVGDDLDDLRREVRVELDLLEAGGVVALDGRARFFRRLGGDVTERARAARVDETREQHARSNRVIVLDRVADGDEKVELATAVARRRDARGQMRRPEFHARRVRVHLPQARQQRLALAVDRPACPRGIGVVARGPAAAIRLSRTMTTASGTGGLPVASMSVAPAIAYVPDRCGGTSLPIAARFAISCATPAR